MWEKGLALQILDATQIYAESLYLIKKLLGKYASSFPHGGSSSIPEGRASPRVEHAPIVPDLACSHCFSRPAISRLAALTTWATGPLAVVNPN